MTTASDISCPNQWQQRVIYHVLINNNSRKAAVSVACVHVKYWTCSRRFFPGKEWCPGTTFQSAVRRTRILSSKFCNLECNQEWCPGTTFQSAVRRTRILSSKFCNLECNQFFWKPRFWPPKCTHAVGNNINLRSPKQSELSNMLGNCLPHLPTPSQPNQKRLKQ